jgi:hypothetical protein
MQADESNSSVERAEIRHPRLQWFAFLFAAPAMLFAWQELVEFPPVFDGSAANFRYGARN